jgi:hypothetical protein
MTDRGNADSKNTSDNTEILIAIKNNINPKKAPGFI